MGKPSPTKKTPIGIILDSTNIYLKKHFQRLVELQNPMSRLKDITVSIFSYAKRKKGKASVRVHSPIPKPQVWGNTSPCLGIGFLLAT